MEPRLRRKDAFLLLGLVLALYAIVSAAFLTAGCASVGKSDPVLVRAEDVETNSLHLYNAVIVQYHMSHSKEESPEVYAALEKIRVLFPPAWRSLHRAIPAYKSVRDAQTLTARVVEVEALYAELKEIWATHLLPKETP